MSVTEVDFRAAREARHQANRSGVDPSAATLQVAKAAVAGTDQRAVARELQGRRLGYWHAPQPGDCA